MANPQHQEILNRGVAAWNAWRKENPLMSPELSGLLLEHRLRFSMQYGSRDVMDWQSDAEERSKCYQALNDGSIYCDSYWEDCWSIRDLRGINFKDVDLSGAELILADLSAADLKNADLRGAKLQRSVLKEADLTDANLERALLGNTKFANTDLSRAHGLLSCRHTGPSLVDLSTVHKSAKLPRDFLFACGLSPLDIRIAEISTPGLAAPQIRDIAEDIRKLVEQPAQVASCFISYSSRDEDFANQLYDDLRKREVRCWFAPHDIRGGKKICEQIGDAIRQFERLLLILSEHSMKSQWVNTEIASARKREVLEKRQVLFPIRLVSFEAIKAWESFDADIGRDSAKEIREYFIPDFSEWRDKVAYEKSLQRLLDDLNAIQQSA
jgi:hypothetical protein